MRVTLVYSAELSQRYNEKLEAIVDEILSAVLPRAYRQPYIEFVEQDFDKGQAMLFLNDSYVILGIKYGMPMDIWAFGCILAELLIGKPLLPGENEEDQLALIIELRGISSSNILQKSKRANKFFTLNGLPKYCTQNILKDGKMVLGMERFEEFQIQEVWKQ